MSDYATFKRSDLEMIFGTHPKCMLCGKLASEAHHITCRGYTHGYKKNNPERRIMSSILNCGPLCGGCHSSGVIHHPDTESYLLNETLRIVSTNKYYEWKPEDKDFKEKFSSRYQYLRKSSSPKSP